MKQYSFTKGAIKAVIAILSFAGGLAVATGVADVAIVDLIREHVFPILGGLSVGGVITLLMNFIKVKYLSNE